MLDANLIIVSAMICWLIASSVKVICDSIKIISENRKEEARYKYLEKKLEVELEKNSKDN